MGVSAHRVSFLSHGLLFGGAGLLHYPLLKAVVSHLGQEGPVAKGAGHQGVGATGVPGAGLVRRGDIVTLANIVLIFIINNFVCIQHFSLCPSHFYIFPLSNKI